MKKKILSFGLLGVMTLPAIAMVSCGSASASSWENGSYELNGSKTKGITLKLSDGEITEIVIDTDVLDTAASVKSAFYILEYKSAEEVFGDNIPSGSNHILEALRKIATPYEFVTLTEANAEIELLLHDEVIDHSEETQDNLGNTPETPVHTPGGAIAPVEGATETPDVDTTPKQLHRARTLDEVSEVLSVDERTDWSNFALKDKFINRPEPVVATVYHTRFMDFAFDKNTHITDTEARYLIRRFYETTTYGYGLLFADTVLFLEGPLDVLGVRAGKDTLNGMPDLNFPNEQDPAVKERKRNEKLQEVFDTARHEYGHHETLSPVGDRGPEIEIAKKLIAEGYPLAEALQARVDGNSAYFKDPVTGIDKMVRDASFNADGTRLAVSGPNGLYSAPYFSTSKQRMYNTVKDGFDLQAYLLGGAEIYNRAINVLEYSPYRDKDYILSSIIGWVDVWMYYVLKPDHSATLLDPKTGLYNQENTNKIIELWNKYVYRNDVDKIYITPWKIMGYSTKDFDFVQYPIGGTDKVSLVDSVQSHFITGRTSIDTAPTWGGQIAYYSNHNSGQYINENRKQDIKFYKDDGDGIFESDQDTLVPDVMYEILK